MAHRTLHVIGGTYIEKCDEPGWDQLQGSGLRAAAAISSRGLDVTLSTYCDHSSAADLKIYASTFELRLEVRQRATPITFVYPHPLARPQILPSLHLLEANPPIGVEASAVLRFGMLEGEGVVQGRRVVYDPQAKFDPKPFAANGSTAKHLAIVANHHEAQLLAGKASPTESAEELIRSEGAEVVVLKGGASGLTVFVAEGGRLARTANISAFATERVFPIGSGDVFSAVFASEWASAETDPVKAASDASIATAVYCATRALPVAREPVAVLGYDPPPLTTTVALEPPLVYLAGPFFTMTQRWLIREARDGLAGQGVRVFSPLHDVGLGPAEDVAPEDIKALRRCQSVLAIVDGTDAGTLFEIGYARSLGIPVIAFTENEPEEPLKMLRGTGCEVHNDFATSVYRAVWAAQGASATSRETSQRNR